MEQVEIVEVGPRDGFQSIAPFIPTETKIGLLADLHRAGIRRIETTSFVSPSAVPQLADAAEMVAAGKSFPALDAQILVPMARHAERALRSGATHLAFFLSVSERHNLANVRRTPQESAEEYERIVALSPAGTRLRLNLATAFDCPYEGKVPQTATLDLVERLLPIAPYAEVALCDTTGRATPRDVSSLFAAAAARFPDVENWAFHGHDTYGLGAANVLAAWHEGVRVIDAAISGLGGCPFAPGATGNVATEDVVWMFENMGVQTGIDMDALLVAAQNAARLPGAQTGGRVRTALAARACIAASVAA